MSTVLYLFFGSCVVFSVLSLFFSGGAHPREGAARLAGSRAGARSSVVGREEDEDGRASGTGFGFAVGEGRFWVRDPFSIRYSNYEIGLAFACSPLETVLGPALQGILSLISLLFK